MSGTPNGGLGFRGFQEPDTAGSDFGAHAFLIESMIAKIAGATLVQVKAVTNAGGLSPVGFVDILPLVNQVDGAGNAVPHGTISHCPYFRLQGGTDAVILDPKVGDIGIAVFASRDISSVMANKGQANPGSRRQHDMADGIYIGGVLNGTPIQYLLFSADGIKAVSPTAITVHAPTVTVEASAQATVTSPQITLNGNTLINGTLSQGTGAAGGTATIQGPVTVVNDLTAAGTSVHGHVHGGVTTGQGTTGTPV